MNPDTKTSRQMFDRFDYPVEAARDHAQLGTGQGDCLMVQAVDFDRVGSQKRCQVRILFELQPVAALRVVELVVLGIGHVVGKVVVQGAAEFEGQQLCSITDSQHRNPTLESAGEEFAIEGDLALARGFELNAFGIGIWRREVVAAGQEQRVDPFYQRRWIVLNWEMECASAGFADRPGIGDVVVEILATRANPPPGVVAF